jgi:hypothetical protein
LWPHPLAPPPVRNQPVQPDLPNQEEIIEKQNQEQEQEQNQEQEQEQDQIDETDKGNQPAESPDYRTERRSGLFRRGRR